MTLIKNSGALVLIVTLILSASFAQKYTICTTPQNFNACEQLNRSENLKCVLKKNTLNCLLMVESGNATFTSVSAEDAFLASSLTNNLVILGEFISTMNANLQTNNADFETVILAKPNFNEGFNSLKGARVCHPGIDINQISPFILKEFDMQTLSQNNIEICPSDVNRSLYEHYLSALNDFFGVSCRPGTWVIGNRTLDSELKGKYPKLLELCQITAYQEDRHQPFLQSLKCLVNGGGDIALTTINTINNYKNPALNNYTLICRNGTRPSAFDVNGCSWTKQPWPLLIGNRDLIGDVLTDLRNWFVLQPFDAVQQSEKYVQSLREIIFPGKDVDINVTFHTPSLGTYIKDFRDKPTTESSRLCKTSAILCVTSTEEEKKCKWLQQAALNYAIQPVIECVTKTSKLECLKAMQNKVADLAVIDANLMYTANGWNSSVVAIAEERNQDMRQTVLVVNTTTIQSLQDLQGKKAFFAEYGDIAWLSFANLLKKTIWTDPKHYGEEFSNFLGESCMPGAQDQDRDPTPSGIKLDKVCALCGSDPASNTTTINCNADSSNPCYGNSGALKCLASAGDFAVITLNESTKLPANTTIMCRNGTLVSSNTINIDNDCALSTTVSDVVVVRSSRPKNRDIENLLQELDERFAAQTHTPFKIFDIFGNTKDLIFKDTTLGVEIASPSANRHAKAQLELFENIPRPKPAGGTDGGGGGDGSGGSGGNEDTGGFASTKSISLVLIFNSILLVVWFNNHMVYN